MAKFFMFGNYTAEGIKGLSAERTERASNMIKEHGGEVDSVYALLGDRDLVLILDLPGIKEAMKVSVAMSKMTGIAFSTSPAISVEEFDQLMVDI